METLQTEILVVGGGVGGTAAAIQAARRGRQVILVSAFDWLGGMLTSAGVTAPDGNELAAWQTGLWGAFLEDLRQRQPGGLDNGWVSFFTYEPRVGAQILADWVKALPNLRWIAGQRPQQVLRLAGGGDRPLLDNPIRDRILGVRFTDYEIRAQITLDGTELGDLLALGEIEPRWGWEFQAEFGEPSAPVAPSQLTRTYPVQAPTWVVVMQNYGQPAPPIPAPPDYEPARFSGAWQNHGGQHCLNYGRLPNPNFEGNPDWQGSSDGAAASPICLPGDRWMINWPIRGNDYGEDPARLIGSPAAQAAFEHAALAHSQAFAHYLQTTINPNFGLAEGTFATPVTLSDGQRSTAFALHPYYRESRRLKGLVTVKEQDLLPIAKGQVAALPMQVDAAGCDQVESLCSAIAIGNYANDHHYPSGDIPLQPKSIRWGGRWTGTPFTIPYGALVPAHTDGLLVCEKNISVTHMANGATRLQPVVMGIGQAAGMAAALCVELGIEGRSLSVRHLQDSLLQDPTAPAAVIPLFNLPPQHPDWLYWQRYYLDHPEAYGSNGYAPVSQPSSALGRDSTAKRAPIAKTLRSSSVRSWQGAVSIPAAQTYEFVTPELPRMQLVTLDANVDQALMSLLSGQKIQVAGTVNWAGLWIVVTDLEQLP
jgi:hypothetical protein